MPITTSNIDLYLRGVRADFALVVDQAEKQLAAYDSNVYLDAANKTGPLFDEYNAIGQQRVEFNSVTGVKELQPTAELQPFPEVTYVPSFITTVEPYKFADRIRVSYEAAERRDSKYQSALNEASKLNITYANTKARHRFDKFNQGASLTTAAYTQLFDYGDGVATFASNHPDKVGGTHSNIVTASDITPTSIETMILVLQNQVDDIGEPMPMGGGTNFMIVPPNKVKKAKENIDSEWEVGTANNTINVWKTTGFTLVSSPFLGTTNSGSNTAWYIVDGMFSPFKDVMFKSVINDTWEDKNNKSFVHDIEFQHRVGNIDYRGAVRNAGA